MREYRLKYPQEVECRRKKVRASMKRNWEGTKGLDKIQFDSSSSESLDSEF